jgi:hypothetical protein
VKFREAKARRSISRGKHLSGRNEFKDYRPVRSKCVFNELAL